MSQFAVGFRLNAEHDWTYYGPFATSEAADEYADSNAGHDDSDAVDETTVIILFPK